jgi:hypothetical protein
LGREERTTSRSHVGMGALEAGDPPHHHVDLDAAAGQELGPVLPGVRREVGWEAVLRGYEQQRVAGVQAVVKLPARFRAESIC